MPSKFTLYNPLDKFASYSIQHVVLACRTTEEARAFTNESENTATLAAIDQVGELGEAIPYGKTKDSAFLVIDTRRFSQFAIENMKYEVLINNVEASGAHGNLATTINMTIVDHVGISFINFLQWLMDDKMKTNFDGMIFMHRLMFIGHLPDGTSDTVQTVTIPMHLQKLELSLEHTKGVYAAEFLPNMNFDTTRGERWLNISSATRYYTGASRNTLGAMVQAFEDGLNAASAKYFQDVQNARKEDGLGAARFGRMVKYMITLPQVWEELEFTGASTADATEKIFEKKIKEKVHGTEEEQKAKAEKKAAAEKEAAAKAKAEGKEAQPKDTHLAVEPGILITDVLRIMLDQVKGIAEYGTGKVTQDSVVFYKMFTAITSDDDIVIVHVDVVPFEVPNVVPETKGTGISSHYVDIKNDDGSTSRVPKNYAAFDYIFTGNNKDILNFDMKMADLAWFLASNLHLGGAATEGFDDKKTDKPNRQAELVTARMYDALILPKNTGEELSNFKKYNKTVKEEGIKTSQDYTRNLSMYYAMSPITALMTIRGNPDIMTKFNQASFVPHINTSTVGANGTVTTASTEQKKKYREEFEKSILENNTHLDGDGNKVYEIEMNDKRVFKVARTLGKTNYASSPVFVKVNINGPNVDARTGIHAQTTNTKADFAKELIQDNYYVVFKVVNTIEGHTFTQDLELYSHNIFGENKLEQPVARTV